MLDEAFAALDAFTREELWCVIRDLHASRKITVCLVTHDLREAVFLADRIFVMSARPGRVLVDRSIGFPRPRDLEVTFTKEFQDIVYELRSHIVIAVHTFHHDDRLWHGRRLWRAARAGRGLVALDLRRSLSADDRL